MPEFVCKVGTVEGDVIERVYASESAESLRRDLERKDYLIFSIRRKGGALGLFPAFGRKRIKMKEFLVFNQQLAALIQAGLPIVSSLDVLLERRKNPVFRKALTDIRDQVKSGAALSEAFATRRPRSRWNIEKCAGRATRPKTSRPGSPARNAPACCRIAT